MLEVGEGIQIGPGILLGTGSEVINYLITEDNNNLTTETGLRFIEE